MTRGNNTETTRMWPVGWKTWQSRSTAIEARKYTGPTAQTITGIVSYRVLRDAISSCRADVDRSLTCCFLATSFFGFAGREGDFYGLDAVVDDTSVACYPREALQAVAASDPAVAKKFVRWLFGAMARLQHLILILGRTTAREKVGAFLLRIMQRVADETDRLVYQLPVTISRIISRYRSRRSAGH